MTGDAEPVGASGRARLEELLEHAAWVRGLALALLREAAAADDVVQETWLAALRRPPERDRPLRPWLAGVVRNLVRQRRRGEARRGRREEEVGARRAAETSPSPAELTARLETQRELAALVAELPEPLRATVLQRYYEGVEPAEIARREGVPGGTVRWRLKRARDLLRERLDARHAGDRRAWALALVPLAARPAPRGPGAVSGTAAAAAAKGVLTMGIGTKLGIAGAAVVLLAALLGGPTLLDLASTARETPSDEPVEVSFRPEERPTRGRRADADGTTVGTAGSTEDSADGGARSETAQAAPPTRISGRVLDADGRALADAEVALDSGAFVRTAADGRFEIDLTTSGAGRTRTVYVAAAAHATAAREVRVAAGATAHVGDVRLEPGGSVSGRVVDAQGEAVEGAWVGLADASTAPVPYAERRRMSRFALHGLVTGATAADGSFTLHGVPVGMQRIWAGKDAFLATLSGPVEVRRGMQSGDAELVLESLDPDDVISGRVVAPDGSPVPGAALEYRYEGRFGRSGMGTMTGEPDGTFRLVVPHRATYTFLATDPEGRFGGAAVEDVEPGRSDVVLRLAEVRYLELRVVDGAGGAVERFAVTVSAPRGVSLFEHHPEAAHSEGALRVRVPAARFVVRVLAPGFDEASAGPFDPSETPESARVALQALPGLQGRVTAAGKPIAAAAVHVHEVVSEGVRVVHNGFVTHVHPGPVAKGISRPDGSFRVTLRESGRFVVRVAADGFAAAVRGPEDFDHRLGRSGLDFQLTPGGAIEGRVLVPPGRDAEGTIIGISRADGHPRTVRAGPGGAFRFERLTPGPWVVRRADEEIVPGSHSTSEISGSSKVAWSCEVRDGGVTEFDLDLRPAATWSLAGRLSADGEGAAAWTATLVAADAKLRTSDSATARVGRDGTFTLAAPSRGKYRLILSSPAGALRLLAPVEVTGRATPWDLAIRFGRVEGEGAPPTADEPGATELALVWEGPDDVIALAPVAGDAEGRFTVPEAPAGSARIVRIDRTAAEPDPRRWPAVAEFEVNAGATNRVKLRP